MTTEELRDACEVVLRSCGSFDGATAAGRARAGEAWDCAQAVARALLARLPAADDAEPVTEEWLASVGIRRNGCLDRAPHYRLPYRPGMGLRVFLPGLADGVESPTRGAVRRLLAALNVTAQTIGG